MKGNLTGRPLILIEPLPSHRASFTGSYVWGGGGVKGLILLILLHCWAHGSRLVWWSQLVQWGRLVWWG